VSYGALFCAVQYSTVLPCTMHINGEPEPEAEQGVRRDVRGHRYMANNHHAIGSLMDGMTIYCMGTVRCSGWMREPKGRRRLGDSQGHVMSGEWHSLSERHSPHCSPSRDHRNEAGGLSAPTVASPFQFQFTCSLPPNINRPSVEVEECAVNVNCPCKGWGQQQQYSCNSIVYL
jgi:hypothetical protein